MSETAMRSDVVKWLKPLHAVAVENGAGIGTPDVNYVEGWIELKQLPSWPKRTDTIVKVEHFTRQQRIWLIQRSESEGNCWLLLRVKREWLLFRGAKAARVLGRCPRKLLYEFAVAAWNDKEGARKGLMRWLLRGN